MKKIRANEAALRFIQFGMRLERLFHLRRAILKEVEQIPVTTFEIFQHITELSRGCFAIKTQNPFDNMVGPKFVGRIKIAGFGRRFKGSDDDPGRVGAQVQYLAVQE
jgi:hypothetical protein